jgi:hypothetical protein
MVAPTFPEFLASIGRIGEAAVLADPTVDVIASGAARLQAVDDVNLDTLAALVTEKPEWIRVLGLAVGLGQEQLQITLYERFDTRSYGRLARKAREVVQVLDDLGLVQRILDERGRIYGYGDVLLERYGSRARAGRAIGRGKALEDAVEAIVAAQGLPHVMRTNFQGQAGRTAPCDLAIPAGGGEAAIVVGIKGFNSTGSKLTDARREIEEMAKVRLPRHFVLAVVDGLGWRSRKADLEAIHQLWVRHEIDGLYTQASLDQFGADVATAARLRAIVAGATPDGRPKLGEGG